MAPAPPTAAAALPDDPVQQAANDPETRAKLVAHARARFGRRLAGRPAAVRDDLTEDAVQEAVKRALQRRADYDPTRATPAGWMHGILERVVAEFCRTTRNQPSQPKADHADWSDLAARATDPTELAELLARLSTEHRQIVSMHHLDEMSHQEIATVLGITVGASRVRLARAMNELRKLVTRVEGG